LVKKFIAFVCRVGSATPKGEQRHFCFMSNLVYREYFFGFKLNQVPNHNYTLSIGFNMPKESNAQVVFDNLIMKAQEVLKKEYGLKAEVSDFKINFVSLVNFW
jgi:hypothetical protein